MTLSLQPCTPTRPQVDQNQKKQRVAEAAVEYVKEDTIIGVGTGSTVNYFIEKLADISKRINGAVASSVATENLLKKYGIPIVSLNDMDNLVIYIDGADEATRDLHLIKGGGGALTREKIIASASKNFICIVDDSKLVDVLGKFPLPVEVIPMAQNYVSREIVKLGGRPVLRDGVITDNGNNIIDVEDLTITAPAELEETLNNITGVVTNGLFARRPADKLLVADNETVRILSHAPD